MIQKNLKNLAYLFYPKNIDNILDKENYLKTFEYKNLTNTLNEFSNYLESDFYIKIIDEIKNIDHLKNITDVTVSNWEDRCISLEIDVLRDSTLNKICIHISFLVPLYLIYILENEIELNPYKWKTVPMHNPEKEQSIFLEEIKTISCIIEKQTGFNKFPIQLANETIPNINFQDIEMGEFNFFNAFFLNQNKL
ncbi:hypothetical protein GFJ94_09060 [Flavobacterium sp. LMO8]|uniref:hypothetical protein n=1 Tax=Flavobacterium sp. LMO8 TaxID=2654244 RepID=UPI0012927152|nr:hypothetical protein [Flavobacterium sp. LMO8]MQP25213.1 hypothetical protein [Flavobacterium sp. LMO8]